MAHVSQSKDHAPTHFGKYLLDQQIARGGMSRVFRARLRGPLGFEKRLVVKQILPELARDPSFIELFVKEANTLVQMSHPGLVPVYELGVVDGVYFLAMEWIEGATIAELLRNGPLPAALVAQIGAEIAEALRYAHERFQIVHRDVTPRNVIIDGAGHARLLDFGIAAPVELTGQGELFGSAGYMAPEQLSGEALGPESDLFALGAVLYEAACGQPALPRHTSKAHLPYPVVPTLTELHPTLRELIGKLLRHDRSLRPGAAGEVATVLRTWLAAHHPGGVERELAARAQHAHDAREAEAAPEPGEAEAEAGAISGPVEVRSIAQSPVLDELLKQATERIERPAPVGGQSSVTDELMTDPQAQVTLHRFVRDGVVITAALVAALVWAELRPLRHDTPPRATARSTQHAAAPAKGPAERLAVAATAGTPLPLKAAEPVMEAPSASASADTVQFGYVTVNAVPWAQLRVDGRALGNTPRRRLPLRAGKHTLNLDCPPLGHTARVPLELRAGQTLQVLVNLQSDPPQISLR
jgi:serine/threonine-protein kinase